MAILDSIKTFLDSANAFVLLLDKHALLLGSVRISAYSILKTIIVVTIVLWATKIISGFIRRILKRGIRNKSNRELASKILDTLLYLVVFLIILRILGLDLATFAIFGGALGIGLGFGLQKVTSNFISGLILLTEKSVEIDDLVELDGNIYGWIRKLGGRYTLVETIDGKEIMIPNEDFITNKVTNWTFTNTKGRIQAVIGVSYDSDIKKAKTLILEAASEHRSCMTDPKPECYLTEYADSSVNFTLFFWVENVNEGRWGPKNDVLFSIWDKFKKNDIKIPYPQRDVYIKETPHETK